MIATKPKDKLCYCGRAFTPARPLQAVCSASCAVRKAKKDRVESVKAEKAATRTRKEKVKTNGERKAEAQAAINKWIVHVRDKDQPCISCGRFHDGAYHAGHYRSRGSAPHLALDPRNLAKQCAPCNMHLHGNLIEFRKGLIARYGISHVEELEADQTPRHLSPQDLDAIKEDYKNRLKEAKKQA